jgi:hypothetical protein
MKLQNIFRMQAVVIGFAAVLLLASSAPAQEIDNTSWDDGPNVATIAQPAPALTTDGLSSTTADSHTVATAAMIAKPIVTREGVVSPWTSVEVWAMASSLVFFALIALYALVEAKRANRNLNARASRANSWSALS